MIKDIKPSSNKNSLVALIALLNPDQIQLLVKLLNEVIDETGHGRVQIVIVDKRVKHLRSEKSY